MVGLLFETLRSVATVGARAPLPPFNPDPLIWKQEVSTFIATILVTSVCMYLNYSSLGCQVLMKGYKIKKIFGQKSTYIKENYCILSIEVSLSCQKVPKLDFQD